MRSSSCVALAPAAHAQPLRRNAEVGRVSGGLESNLLLKGGPTLIRLLRASSSQISISPGREIAPPYLRVPVLAVCHYPGKLFFLPYLVGISLVASCDQLLVLSPCTSKECPALASL